MRIGIYGYGNLGKGVECAIKQNPDTELIAVFTRRNPDSLKINTDSAKVVHVSDIDSYVDKIDVLVICGGSATDLPEMTPSLASKFCVIDSFDTHADIPTHFAKVDKSAREGDKLALISAGWDPGMFSLNRVYADAILPCGKEYTFWGKGVSQGHSDAIRRIDGVQDARQYTCPVESVVDRVRAGDTPDLTTREKHTRLCYVVAKEGADLERIKNEIVTMPKYFADYDTTVNFITQEELDRDHKGIPHGGMVIRVGKTSEQNSHVVEYKIKLDSNPEFTASAIVAFARAVYKKYQKGERGCITVLDVAPSEMSAKSPEELRAHML